MALIQIPVTKKNDISLTSSKTYGMNTEKIVDFYKEDGDTVLWYVETEDRRRKPVKWVTSLTMQTLRQRFASTLEAGADTDFLRRRLNLSAVARGYNDSTWNVNVNLDANRISYVWDSGNYGYVEFDTGAWGPQRIKVQESLSQVLEEAGSGSAVPTA